MATCVVLVPDGVGLRNFLLSGCLASLSDSMDVIAFHNMSPEVVDVYARPLAPRVQWQSLRPYVETPAAHVVRNTLAFAHMYCADTQALRLVRQRPVRGAWRTVTVHRIAKTLGRLAASGTGVRALDRMNVRLVERSACGQAYTRILSAADAAMVFCTNQRPSCTAPAVYAARKLGIPTATFIFSWDNLTSKGRMAAEYDHYLVWGTQMRQELLRMYPHVRAENVHVTGTPQFDSHAGARFLVSRQEFFRSLGADPNRPLICYSGGDAGTCPEDQDHVRILLELVRKGRIDRSAQVLLRPTPVDPGTRYARVRAEYPELIYSQPEWYRPAGSDWSAAVPLMSDMRMLANLTRHADVNVNLASTMTLDCAIHDTPVVNVAFDVQDPPPRGVPVWDYYYRFDHFRPVIDWKASAIARSPEQLAAYVSAYLRDPSLDRDGRRKLVDLQIGVPVGHSCDAVVSVLQNIAQPHASLLPV